MDKKECREMNMDESLNEFLHKRKEYMIKNPTPAESRFKTILEDAINEEYDFIQQRIFYNRRTKKSYIADFYLPYLDLVFEIDGSTHDSIEAQEHDFRRSRFLNLDKSIKVIRIKNQETYEQQKIFWLIKNEIKTRKQERRVRARVLSGMPLKSLSITSEQIQDATQQFLQEGGTIKVIPNSTKKKRKRESNAMYARRIWG